MRGGRAVRKKSQQWEQQSGQEFQSSDTPVLINGEDWGVMMAKSKKRIKVQSNVGDDSSFIINEHLKLGKGGNHLKNYFNMVKRNMDKVRNKSIRTSQQWTKMMHITECPAFSFRLLIAKLKFFFVCFKHTLFISLKSNVVDYYLNSTETHFQMLLKMLLCAIW